MTQDTVYYEHNNESSGSIVDEELINYVRF